MREIKKGGLNDPVAQSIRNEQMQDARPSKEEMKREQEKHYVRHAEYKATVALLEHFDAPTSQFVIESIAETLDFSLLAKRARRGHNWGDFCSKHDEPHERPDDPHPQARMGPPTKVNDEIRRLKQEKFLIVQSAIDTFTDIRTSRKIMNPFGASKAWVVVIEETLHPNHIRSTTHDRIFTNDTFEKSMDATKWSDTFEVEKIVEYQEELKDMYMSTVLG